VDTSGSFTTLPRSQYAFNQTNQSDGATPLFPTVFTIFNNDPKNGIQLPDYHRLDLGVEYTKPTSFGQSTLKFSFYNVYSRFNPVYYRFTQRTDGVTPYTETAFLPIIVPTVRYTAKFLNF